MDDSAVSPDQQQPVALRDASVRYVETASINSTPPNEKNEDETDTTLRTIADTQRVYARLIELENKCREDYALKTKRNRDWQALHAQHCSLFDEHHEFLLVSQCRSTSSPVRHLVAKHNMLARMWEFAVRPSLELLLHRLPDSKDQMVTFIQQAYATFASLEEGAPGFHVTWAECRGDIARYSMVVEEDMKLQHHWKCISREDYTRVTDENPTTGRIYHHLAILQRPRRPQDAFDCHLAEFFYYTKALVVTQPFFAAQISILNPIKEIALTREEMGGQAKVFPAATNPLLAAVSHLILASQADGSGKEDHLREFRRALKMIAGVPGPLDSTDYMQNQPPKHVQTWKLHPSAELALLLCLLPLAIPFCDEKWGPMMAAWAPDLVMPEARVELADMIASGRDVFDLPKNAFHLISVVIDKVTEQEDTSHLGLWEFLYVLLVFMRAMATRPDMLSRFGPAFHAERLAPFLNKLLRDAKAQDGKDKVFQWKPSALCSPLNKKEKLGKYGMTTDDQIHEVEEKAQKTAVGVENEATSDAAPATLQDAMHTERINRTNPLREDHLLRGLPFAREPNSYWQTPPPEPSRPAKKPSASAVARAADKGDAEQAQARADPETERKVRNESLGKEEEVGMHEEQKREADESRLKREAEVACLQEAERAKALTRDPPFFNNDWFSNSNHDFEDREVMRHGVQSLKMVEDRFVQILLLGSHLVGTFFTLEVDDNGCDVFSVPGIPFVPQLGPDAKMPEVVERDKVSVVYVDPSLAEYVADMDEAREKMARESEERGKKLEQEKAATTGRRGRGRDGDDGSDGWTHTGVYRMNLHYSNGDL